jgi:hypothetical protein
VVVLVGFVDVASVEVGFGVLVGSAVVVSVDEAEVELLILVGIEAEVGSGVEVGEAVALPVPDPDPVPPAKQYRKSSLNPQLVEFPFSALSDGFHLSRSAAETSKNDCTTSQSLTPGNPNCRSLPST